MTEEKKQMTPKEWMRALSVTLFILGFWVIGSNYDGQGHLNCNHMECVWNDGFGSGCDYPIPIPLLIWRFIYSSVLIFAGYKVWVLTSAVDWDE